jgi:CHAT domain-containing protein/Tfp pilus assembly protein PilF
MLKPTTGRPRPNSSARNSLRLLTLLLSLLWLACAHGDAARALGRRPPPAQPTTRQQSAGAQDAQESTTLEPGKPVERELAGGQEHVYQLALAEGQYAKVAVEQRGVDLSVRLHGADGKLIAEFDFESRNQGREEVAFVAEAAGSYRLEVAPTLKGAPARPYEIRLDEARAATERERALSEATGLFAEASRLYQAEQYRGALPLAERAAQILDQNLGTESREFARALNLVANLHAGNKDYAKAEPLYQRALEIRERVRGAEHPDVASSLYDLARFHSARRDRAKAVSFSERALALREKALDANHFHTGLTLYNYGSHLFDARDYARAEGAWLRAASILEKALGDDSPKYSAALHNLGFLYDTTGDFGRAEQLYRRELASRERAKGEESGEAAYVLHYIARIYSRQGEYDKAEALYQRAYEIDERLGDEDGALVALGNLAGIHSERGDYERAEGIYRQVLERRERAAEPNQISIASALLNLGVVNNNQGDYATAEMYLKRSLSIIEAVRKGDGLERAHVRQTLAAAHIGRGDYAAAEELARLALATYERVNGPDHPYVAQALGKLGRVAYLRGDYAGAESSYRRALAVSEKSQGANNPSLAGWLKSLADVLVAKGDLAEALELRRRADAVSERHLALALATGSERQKLNYLASSVSNIDGGVTFNLRHAPDDSRASELALTTVLRLKGRVLDSMSDTLSALRRRASPEDRELLERWNEATTQLARRVLSDSQASAETRAQVGALEEKREKLEDEISRRSAEFRAQKQAVTLDSVRRAIPDGAALVEFVIYRPLNPKASDDRTARGEPRYVAYVTRNRGEVRWAELGAAKEVDGAVDGLRQALRDPRRKDARQLARALDEKLMRPVRALAGDATHLLVSPDGQLNLMPFEALVDEREHYLVERYAFTYLTSGRDLLRLQVAREGKGKPAVVADPTFGEPAAEQLAKVGAPRRPVAPGARRRSTTAARSLAEVYFTPLGGTADEAGTIQRLFREVNLLTRSRATESALKALEAPRVLHVATHGFFLEDADTSAGGGARPAARGIGASAKIENPLLRSGLALAGANVRGGGGGDDGILTALEASGLNLWGTKLVVLSACDTGLGEVKNGEGVYGLRRAFVLAGAESLVMSLWPVSDYPTRGLMTSYYENLIKQGMGRGAALRRVQLKMIAERRHPFYWANFIQSGEWANLDGERSETFD